MSLATTAILASAIRPKSDSTPAAKTTSITESIAQRPIQWLIVAGAVVYFGGKFIKNVIPTGDNIRKGEAETSTSTDNPWSATTFLSQKIPVGTNLITAAGAFQQAKKVYDSLNTYFSDDADIAVGVFAALPSKVQVALVVKSFEAYYKRNILEYLKSGKKTFDFGTGGISDALYNRIIENVKRKPKF
jgi:hypothetical protein